jgi:hypothetical protein
MFRVEAACFSGSAGSDAGREKRLLKLHMLGGQESRKGGECSNTNHSVRTALCLDSKVLVKDSSQ